MNTYEPIAKSAVQHHSRLRTPARLASQDDLHRIPTIQRAASMHPLIKMQRMYGNRYVQSVLAVARKGAHKTEAAPEVEGAIRRARGGGQSLDKNLRLHMESAFGTDFGRVRVHTNAEADQLNRTVSARAFTTGHDIFFRSGEYNPGSSQGRQLLAHELTHVVQQTGRVQHKLILGEPGDAYEQEADRVAELVMKRERQITPTRSSQEAMQRQMEEEEDHDLIVQAKQVQGQTPVAQTVLIGEPRLQLQGANVRSYRVQPGDSLQRIAAKFGVTVDALKARNISRLKTWATARGNIQGFQAGETIVIPASTRPITPPTAQEAADEKPGGGMLTGIRDAMETARDFWTEFFGGREKAAPPTGTPTPTPPVPAASTCVAKNPIEVIACHNQFGTFGKGVELKVTSTKRDPKKQLDILRNYCKANKAALDEFAQKTDWLKGELDWTAFGACSLSEQAIWLPFFFALFYGGGGPGTTSQNRTLPLVGSPVQAVWKGKTANASPHLAGKAMDVKDGDLDTLAAHIKSKIPEFGKSGPFPVRSTQIENVAGQRVVHINFEKVVF